MNYFNLWKANTSNDQFYGILFLIEIVFLIHKFESMFYLIVSIICSVTVGVLFKWFRKNNSFNSKAVITTNYVVAFILCYFCFSHQFEDFTAKLPIVLFVILGVLLPLVFLLLAQSIKYMGIVKTDAAQRMSLFIPLIASWLFFGENFTFYKVLAFGIAFLALLCILSKPSTNESSNWIYPGLVLLGFGIIDILFKQIALQTNFPFTTSLLIIFSIAFFVMIGVIVYEIVYLKNKIALQNMYWGTFVGIFNFGNIYFYLKAHQSFAQNPSTVFVGMNLGVIVLGSFIGVFVFKEKLSRKNYIGLLLAIIAIMCIAYAQ